MNMIEFEEQRVIFEKSNGLKHATDPVQSSEC